MAAPLTTLVEPRARRRHPSIALRTGTECYAGNGAPVLTVQSILGHRHVDTTLGYARLYDGTIAADYYRAMALVEQRLAAPNDTLSSISPSIGELLALVDALRTSMLSESQRETVQALRAGILALTPVDTESSRH